MGERTRLRGKPRTDHQIPKFLVSIVRKMTGREARPATPGAGMLPNFAFVFNVIAAFAGEANRAAACWFLFPLRS